MPALASNTQVHGSPIKSDETTSSSVYPMMPLIGPSEAAFRVALISSYLADLANRHVKSTTETFAVGTRNAIPVNLPLRSGITLPTALAAPVVEGMILIGAARPPRQSFFEWPSTVFCVAVTACTVVIRPSVIPNLSCTILARGARQFVVQEAFETTVISFRYSSWLTPMTNMGASFEGAVITTLWAPALRCAPAFSRWVKTPVDSTIYPAPHAAHGISSGCL